MRYCMGHTPSEGVGLAKCALCGEPVSDHSLLKLCR